VLQIKKSVQLPAQGQMHTVDVSALSELQH
jgi:hypothetical protein